MKMFSSFNLGLALLFTCMHSDIHASEWKELKKGNDEFVNNKKFARQRSKLKSQNPGTVVLGCIDSRAPPELVFNQGLGKLFVARSGGQVVDDVIIDSIEFCVGHFDVDTLIVLGHTRCGAVEGALARLRKNGGVVDPDLPGHLHAVLIPIEKAIVAAGINIYAPNALKLSIRANISYIANQLLNESATIKKAVTKGKVRLIGAELNVLTGRVRKQFELTGKDLSTKAHPFNLLPKMQDFSHAQKATSHGVESFCTCH